MKTFHSLVGDAEPRQEETPFTQLEAVDLTGSRVLLVEDNKLNAEIATEILEMSGLTVERVADGIEAVDTMAVCENGFYDLILWTSRCPE